MCVGTLVGPAAAASDGGGGAAPKGNRYNRGVRVESARLYGNINKYAYYFTDLLVGKPTPQRVSVIVDTGSSLCGFPCDGCSHCGHHIDPPFDIEGSSSARWIPCGTRCQGSCRQDHCFYTQCYTEGSSISGFWFQDEIRLGDALQHNPPVNATLGCHMDERKLFYTQRVNGIMGMAPHRDNGRPTILQDLFGDKDHINLNVFAICLADAGGQLSVGGWHLDNHVSGVRWIPLEHSGYYSVMPQRLMIGGMDLGFTADKFGTSLVDSGTTFTYFPQEIYRTLITSLVAACTTPPGCGARRVRSDCWRLDDGAMEPSRFPAFALTFETGVVVQWPARAYLFQSNEPGLWCHAFADNGADPDTVLGVSWMLHKDVIFDLEHDRLGVAEAHCPRYWKVPGEQESATAFVAPGMYNTLALSLAGLLAVCALLVLACCLLDRQGYQNLEGTGSWLPRSNT